MVATFAGLDIAIALNGLLMGIVSIIFGLKANESVPDAMSLFKKSAK